MNTGGAGGELWKGFHLASEKFVWLWSVHPPPPTTSVFSFIEWLLQPVLARPPAGVGNKVSAVPGTRVALFRI